MTSKRLGEPDIWIPCDSCNGDGLLADDNDVVSECESCSGDGGFNDKAVYISGRDIRCLMRVVKEHTKADDLDDVHLKAIDRVQQALEESVDDLDLADWLFKWATKRESGAGPSWTLSDVMFCDMTFNSSYDLWKTGHKDVDECCVYRLVQTIKVKR